jgi:competence protein ComGC
MKVTTTQAHQRALTLTEVLVVIVTAAILFAVMLPWLVENYPRRRSARLNCTSNLKQIGLGFRMWSNDHDDKFPMLVSTNEGGSREFVLHGEVFRHFLVLSNELNSPKVLVCPRDDGRVRITNFGLLRSNTNISYFVGLDANEARPQMILSGDRNLTGGTLTDEGITHLRTNSLVGWTASIHNNFGNIGLADGSAQEATPAVLRQQLRRGGTNEFIRLAIPVAP